MKKDELSVVRMWLRDMLTTGDFLQKGLHLDEIAPRLNSKNCLADGIDILNEIATAKNQMCSKMRIEASQLRIYMTINLKFSKNKALNSKKISSLASRLSDTPPEYYLIDILGKDYGSYLGKLDRVQLDDYHGDVLHSSFFDRSDKGYVHFVHFME